MGNGLPLVPAEGQHVADVGGAAEQHGQAVQAQGHPHGGGHAFFQGGQEGLVQGHGGQSLGAALGQVGFEAAALLG